MSFHCKRHGFVRTVNSPTASVNTGSGGVLIEWLPTVKLKAAAGLLERSSQ